MLLRTAPIPEKSISTSSQLSGQSAHAGHRRKHAPRKRWPDRSMFIMGGTAAASFTAAFLHLRSADRPAGFGLNETAVEGADWRGGFQMILAKRSESKGQLNNQPPSSARRPEKRLQRTKKPSPHTSLQHSIKVQPVGVHARRTVSKPARKMQPC